MAKAKKEIVLNKDFDNSLDELLMDGGLKEKISRDEIREIPIDKLKSFKNHPFKVIDDDKMDELVESIRDNGIMSPVIVRPSGDMYELISGHRRTHAAVTIQRQRLAISKVILGLQYLIHLQLKAAIIMLNTTVMLILHQDEDEMWN